MCYGAGAVFKDLFALTVSAYGFVGGTIGDSKTPVVTSNDLTVRDTLKNNFRLCVSLQGGKGL